MLAQLFACRVILGKTSFDQVPKKLKPQVAKILIEDDDTDRRLLF